MVCRIRGRLFGATLHERDHDGHQQSRFASIPSRCQLGEVEAILRPHRVAASSHATGARAPRESRFVADRLSKRSCSPSDGGKPKRRQSETARHKTRGAASANLPASSFNPASVKSAPAPRRNHAADLTEASRFPNQRCDDSSCLPEGGRPTCRHRFRWIFAFAFWLR